MLLMLFQFISMTLSLLFIFARSGVDVLAGFGANVGFISDQLSNHGISRASQIVAPPDGMWAI